MPLNVVAHLVLEFTKQFIFSENVSKSQPAAISLTKNTTVMPGFIAGFIFDSSGSG